MRDVVLYKKITKIPLNKRVFYLFRDSSVVERVTVNHDVAGSNPALGAMCYIKRTAATTTMKLSVERVLC